jgi:hypothetical protein
MRKLTVRKIPAQPGAITGNAGPCMAQQNVPYSITPVPSAATYTWVGPTGSTIFDGVVQSASNTLVTASTSVQVDFGNNAGTVKVRANNLCGSGSYRSLTIAFTCRMAQDETDPAFEIVPNPAKEKADVRFLAAAGTTFRLKLLDISGKLIFEESGQALTGLNIRNLDLRQLTQGIYFVEIILNDRKYSSKLLVE